MKRVNLEKPLFECLKEAFRNKAIITSDGLGDTECIYVSGGKAYYEDGGCLGSFSETYEFLDSQAWAHNSRWFIIGYLTDEEVQAIKEMRKNKKAYNSSWHEKEFKKAIDMK